MCELRSFQRAQEQSRILMQTVWLDSKHFTMFKFFIIGGGEVYVKVRGQLCGSFFSFCLFRGSMDQTQAVSLAQQPLLPSSLAQVVFTSAYFYFLR